MKLSGGLGFSGVFWWWLLAFMVLVGFEVCFFFSRLDGRRPWFPRNSCRVDHAPQGAEQGHSWGGSGDTCATQLLSLGFLLALSFTCSSGRTNGTVTSPWTGFFLCSEETLGGLSFILLSMLRTIPGESPEHQKPQKSLSQRVSQMSFCGHHFHNPRWVQLLTCCP